MRGEWYRGIITGRYTAGQIIDIDVELTQSHLGFMEFRLCTNPGNGAGETQACFNQHLLQRADGGGSRVTVDRTGWYNIRYRLPANVRCARCVLQWNYRAGKKLLLYRITKCISSISLPHLNFTITNYLFVGNNWGWCDDGTGALGCGPQETFRSCSDITIT